MVALATIDDLERLTGQKCLAAQAQMFLDLASSEVRATAERHISLVTDDVTTFTCEAFRRILFLPAELGLDATFVVTEVAADGVALPAADWCPLPNLGAVEVRSGPSFDDCPEIAVTWTHGFDPVPGWIVAIVCAVAQRGIDFLTRSAASTATALAIASGVKREKTGDNEVEYVDAAASAGQTKPNTSYAAEAVSVMLTADETARVRGRLRGLVFA